MKTNKKRVLLFIDWFLPGDKAGGPVRSCANLIDQFGEEFDFSVVTRDTDYTDSKPMEGIKSDAWNILPDGKRVYYISGDSLNKLTIEKLLVEEKYDVIYLNGIWSQPFTNWPLEIVKKLNLNVRIVVAARGMLAPSALAIKSIKKKLFLRLIKFKKTFSSVTFHATSEMEAVDIRNSFGKNAKVLVAGNLPRKINVNLQHTNKVVDQLRIVNVARIAPEKNTVFALKVLSKLKIEVTADFYGSIYDENYWKECELILQTLPSNVQVNFKGALPSEEIFKTLSTYDLLFLPTRGENFGHIILESLQAGTPVLISDQTPWKNLSIEKAGWDLPLNSIDEFVKTIETISGMNSENYLEWSSNAKKWGEKYSNDELLIEKNRALFSSVSV